MTRLAPVPTPPMDDHAAPPDARRRYEEVLVRAMTHAERLLPRDQAFEIAHDVAVDMLARAPEQVTGTLLYIAVTNRMRKLWRTSQRRAMLDGAYLETRTDVVPAWAQPDVDLETRELYERIEAVIAAMPRGMREAFLLVREQELSYKEAAARLGVTVGTVHSQLSRANALFRTCVAQYRADAASPTRSGRGSLP